MMGGVERADDDVFTRVGFPHELYGENKTVYIAANILRTRVYQDYSFQCFFYNNFTTKTC